MSRLKAFISILSLTFALGAAELPVSIRQWWIYTTALSNDGMEGRDTGSAGYNKAAAYVVSKFKADALLAKGSNGFLQPVPLHEVRLVTQQSPVKLVGETATQDLAWLRDISVAAAAGMPEKISGKLAFAGTEPANVDVRGKIVIRLRGNARAPGGQQPQFLGAAAVLSIDGTAGPEPPRWPVAYSVAMRIKNDPLPAAPKQIVFRFNPASADKLFAGSGHTYQELLALSESGKPLPSFELPLTLEATMRFATRDLISDNIIAALPGSDPELKNQYIVLSAHLDGYGFGEPWHGDNLYNGTFDDAAYVATLMDLADKLHKSASSPKRSILFCIFTGEEKGLLGSKYFTTHLTVPAEELAANINLDQLRPIFPLKLMTALAVNDSTLGESARQVAKSIDIEIQPDPEPERNLLRRSDHYNFMQIGVPAIGFIFGYKPGSPEEATYRRWYADRYHSPADDLNQPWDPEAAAKFNDFFDRLVMRLADDANRPAWNSGSPLAHISGN